MDGILNTTFYEYDGNDTSDSFELEEKGLWMSVFYPILLTILIIVTLTGNGLILISFMLEPTLRKLDNAFIISLAIADFMVGFVVMPMYAVWEVTGIWHFLETGCILWQIADCVSSTASFWTLLAMSIDRYITVRQPFDKFTEGRRKRVVIFITLVWLLPILYWVPSLVAIPFLHGQDLVTNCESSTKEFTLVTSILIYCLPTVLMVIFYTLIIYEVRKVKFSPNSMVNEDNAPCGSPGLANKVEKCTEFKKPVVLTGVSELSHSDCSRSLSSETTTSNLFSSSAPNSPSSNGKLSNYAEEMQKKRMQQEMKQRQKMQRHTVRMLGTIIACFLFCWLLWDINWPLAWLMPELAIPVALHHVSCWLAYGNSAINPFVYCFSNPIFWKAIKKVLLC